MTSLRASPPADVAGVMMTTPETRPLPPISHYQRQNFPSSSPLPSPSAPLSIAPETKKTHQGEERAPYGKKSVRADSNACYPPSIANGAERDGGECNGAKSKEREIKSTEVSVATEPGIFFRRNVDVAIQAGSSVRWVTSSRKQAHTDGVNGAMCGVGEKQDIGVKSSPRRSVGDGELIVTIVLEEADHPPVTRRIPRAGGCLDNLFNQPGCYTYYVSSGPVVTGRIVAKTSRPQYRSVKPSAAAKIMEAKHQQEIEIEGSLTRAHEGEEPVDPFVVPEAALIGPKNCFSPLPQSEVASRRISVINETMAVGGSEICANGADEVFETASAAEERDATRVDDVDVADTDDIIGISRGKHESDTFLTTGMASMPSASLSHVPTPPCLEDLSTLEPISAEGESGWPKEVKLCLDDMDKVTGLLGRGHNSDGPSAVAMASPTFMMLPENTPQSKPSNSTQLEHGLAPEPVSAMKWSGSTQDSPVFVDREDRVPEPAVQGSGTDALQATVATLATGSSQSHTVEVLLLAASSRSSSVSTVLEKVESTDVCVSGIDHVAGSPDQKRENEAPPFAKGVPSTSSGSGFEVASMVEEKRFIETKVYAGKTGELNGSSNPMYKGALRHKDVSPSASSMASPVGSPLDASSACASASSEEDDGGAWNSGVYLRETCDIAVSPGRSHGGDVLSSSVTASSAGSSHFEATALPPADDGGETDRLTSTDGQKVLVDMKITKVDGIDVAMMSKSRGIRDDTPPPSPPTVKTSLAWSSDTQAVVSWQPQVDNAATVQTPAMEDREARGEAEVGIEGAGEILGSPSRRYGDETPVRPERGVVESVQKSLVAVDAAVAKTLSLLKGETEGNWNSAINSDGDVQHHMREAKDCCGERQSEKGPLRGSGGDVENFAPPPQKCLLTSAISRQETDHPLPSSDKVRVEFQARDDSEDKAFIEPDAGYVVRSAGDFVFPHLLQPVVPPEDTEPFFTQTRSGDGDGGVEPSSVDSDDVAGDIWIKGSGGHKDTITHAKQCLTTPCAVSKMMLASATAAVHDKNGGIPLVPTDMVAGVCLRPSPCPHEGVGQNPFASSLNLRSRIGGQAELSSGTMTPTQSVGKDDSRIDETLNATNVVDDADAERKATLSFVKDPEIAEAENRSKGTVLSAVGRRDTSESEKSREVSHRNKSSMAVGTGAAVGEFIDEAFEESCTGPALVAPRDHDVPCSSPGSTSDSSTPLDSNAERHDAQGFAKANNNLLGGVDDDRDNVHVVTISSDPSGRFEPEMLRVPSGARVTWQRRECCGISNRSKPEMFVMRLGCPIIETGWQAVRSFSLSSVQPDFTFKFEKGGRFVISSETQPGIETKRGEVFVECAENESESSDSFASSEDSETRSRRSEFKIEGASVEVKGDDGRAGGTANVVRSLTSKAEPRCTYEGKSRGGIGCASTASLPGTVVSNDRCNDVKLPSNSPAPAPHPDGRAHPDEKLHATRDPPCNQAEPGATVVASIQPSKEDKDKRQPMMTLSAKKEYRKKGLRGGSIVDIGGRTTRVVSTPDAQGFAVKYANSVILGEQGTYLRKFGDQAMAKGPNKTLVASDQGFKPAKHLVVEVESIMSIKATSVCPRGCSEQRSVYVVGPMVPKDRRAHDGSKKKNLPRTPTHFITAGAPIEVVFIKPGDYWLVENSSSKRIRVTATPREPKLEPKCEHHETDSSQHHPKFPTETGSEAIMAAFSSSNNVKSKQKSGDVTLDAEGASAGKTATGIGAKVSSPTRAHCENGAEDLANDCKQSRQAAAPASRDVPRKQAREDITFFLPSSQLPPVRAKGDGERVSSDEYDGYGTFHAVGVARVSHPKGFEPLKLELGFAPGLGALVVCELGARQRVTGEVVCRHIAPEAVDSKPVARGEKVNNEDATVVSTSGGAIRRIDSNKQIEADGANMASARLGPGSLRICSFVLGRFGMYRLSFRHEVGASLTVLVCPPRDLPSPAPPVDCSSRKLSVSNSGVNAAYDGLQSRSQKGRHTRRSGEHIRDVIEKKSSERTYRCSRDSDSPARVCNLNDGSKSNALNPSADAGVRVRFPAVNASMMESTQELQAFGVTKSPGVRKAAAGVSRSEDTAINDRCLFMQQQRSQAQHSANQQAVKNEKSKTTKMAALAAEIAPEETAKEAADVEADTTQVASRVARVTPPSPAMVRLDDGVTSPGSTPRASISRKEDIRSEASQSIPMPALVAAVAEVSAAPKIEASTTAGLTSIIKSNATVPSLRGRRNAQRRTRAVVYESKNRKAAPQKEAQLKAHRRCRSKPQAGEQADKADHNAIISDRNLRDGTAIGFLTTTPAAVIPTGWPEPNEGASWTQADVEPEAWASFSPWNEREGRPGVNTDANAEHVYSSGGCERVRSLNAEELSYSTRDVRGQPRSRKPRSFPLQGLPQRPDTSPGAKASQSRPIPPPLSDQVLVRKASLDTSTCSGWGSVSPSVTHGNDNGWPLVNDDVSHDSATSAPKLGEPPASPRGVAESVFSGARKIAEFNHPSNGRRKESCPCQDSVTRIVKSTSTDSLKGLASTADHTSSREKIGNKKGFMERTSVPTAKAADESASAYNTSLPSISVPECAPIPRSSNPIAEGAFLIESPGQACAASSSPRDLQISFGNYVSDTESTTQVAAGTPSVSSSDDHVPFPAAPVEGERGVNTDPLALSKGTPGWTLPVDDRHHASAGLGDAVGKSVCNGDSFAEEFQKPNGMMRSVSEGGWREETTVSALAGTTTPPPDSDEKSVRSWCYPQTAAEETLAESMGAVACDFATPVPAAAAPEAQGSTSTRTEVLTDQSDDQRKPRWGNCSTKISLAERQRRSEKLKSVYLPPEDQGSAPFEARLAAFPEASRQPSGGYWMPEDPEDTLPPPSAYEIEEAALMMKRYNVIIERLRTTGYDDELPNGYRPKIYDLTGGPGL